MNGSSWAGAAVGAADEAALDDGRTASADDRAEEDGAADGRAEEAAPSSRDGFFSVSPPQPANKTIARATLIVRMALLIAARVPRPKRRRRKHHTIGDDFQSPNRCGAAMRATTGSILRRQPVRPQRAPGGRMHHGERCTRRQSRPR